MVPPFAIGRVPETSVPRATCENEIVVPSVRRMRFGVLPDVSVGTPDELVTRADVLAVVSDVRTFADDVYSSVFVPPKVFTPDPPYTGESVVEAVTTPLTAWRGPVREPIVRPFVPETVRAVVEAYVAISFVPSNARAALSVSPPPVVANVMRPEVRFETERAVVEAYGKIEARLEVAANEGAVTRPYVVRMPVMRPSPFTERRTECQAP